MTARLFAFLRELVGFTTPRAVVIDLGTILGLLTLWPTRDLGYLPVRSLWVTVFHVHPYSTGMMRALSRLLHLDLQGALAFNRLSLVVLPLMLGLLGLNLVRWFRVARAARQTL